MTDSARPRNGLLIRLTDERWAHITEEHCELAGLRLDVLGCDVKKPVPNGPAYHGAGPGTIREGG